MRGTKAQRHESTKGFTLSEILVVIVIIVLLLGLAVPAFNLIRGSRSIEGAENQVAALIARARSDAIGLQKPFGVMFFFQGNPEEERVGVAEVYAADFPESGTPTRDVYLDIVEDTDFLYLPAGVLAFTLNNGAVNTTNQRTSDGYLGYHVTGQALGGVILFGSDGQLISRSWGYRTGKGTGNATLTRLGTILGTAVNNANGFVEPGPTGTATPATSAFGFVLVDKVAFLNKFTLGALDDPQMLGTPYASSAEPGEEQWLDDNATPLLINRYNGTLIRGE